MKINASHYIITKIFIKPTLNNLILIAYFFQKNLKKN